MEQLGDAQKATFETTEKMTEQGTAVKYIRSNYFPGDSSCTCLFEADSKKAVKEVNEKTSIPFEESTEVLDLIP